MTLLENDGDREAKRAVGERSEAVAGCAAPVGSLTPSWQSGRSDGDSAPNRSWRSSARPTLPPSRVRSARSCAVRGFTPRF